MKEKHYNILKIQIGKRRQSPLFKSKRCATFAKLLRIKKIWGNQTEFDKATKKKLIIALENRDFKNTLRRLIKLIKAEHVGINIMDITVCGAAIPYNAILGSKLISMLLTSPEIISAYKDRYTKQESIIASSMKGNSVYRDPELVLMGTTSLYGGLCQYDRISIPGAVWGEFKEQIKYHRIKPSLGFSSHFTLVIEVLT